MKKMFNTILLCLFLIFSFTAKSQNLGIDTSSAILPSLPDTINLNDNYNHTVIIQNKNATAYTGIIYLIAAVDTGGVLNSIDTVGTANVTSFGMSDTVSIFYNETYTFLNGYKLAGNIVVVWPIANTGSTSDSLFKNVFILNPSAIDENSESENTILIYPNPAKDFIILKNINSKNIIKQVRIFNLNGQLVCHKKMKTKIDISQLPKGVYILRIGLKEEEIHYKLIKE